MLRAPWIIGSLSPEPRCPAPGARDRERLPRLEQLFDGCDLGAQFIAQTLRAQQRVRFIDQYRSYVINYNLGKDLVRRWIESRGGTADHPDKRWEEFARLLSSPRLPSDLK